MRILRIQASPRGEMSVSRQLGGFLIDEVRRKFGSVDVTTRDLSTGLAVIDGNWIGANFTDADKRTEAQKAVLGKSEDLIAEIEAADVLVMEVPIWNFAVPSTFKAWIDQVVRARRTFRMLEAGYEGLLKDRKAYVIVTSGGVPLGSGYDFATPYIRHILGFIGIKDVDFIDASRLLFEQDKAQLARVAIVEKLSTGLNVAA